MEIAKRFSERERTIIIALSQCHHICYTCKYDKLLGEIISIRVFVKIAMEYIIQ